MAISARRTPAKQERVPRDRRSCVREINATTPARALQAPELAPLRHRRAMGPRAIAMAISAPKIRVRRGPAPREQRLRAPSISATPQGPAIQCRVCARPWCRSSPALRATSTRISAPWTLASQARASWAPRSLARPISATPSVLACPRQAVLPRSPRETASRVTSTPTFARSTPAKPERARRAARSPAPRSISVMSREAACQERAFARTPTNPTARPAAPPPAPARLPCSPPVRALPALARSQLR